MILLVRRHRPLYALLGLLILIMGLATRYARPLFPAGVAGYIGDALWASLVYLLAAIALPSTPIKPLATGTALFSLLIETSQLYQAHWLNNIRHTLLGGLILGYGFDPVDLLCYALGIILIALLDHRFTTYLRPPHKESALPSPSGEGREGTTHA